MQITCEWSDDPLDPNAPVCGKPAKMMHTYTKQNVEFGEPFPICDEHLAKLTAEAVGTGNA
jgi:hypothetical protein